MAEIKVRITQLAEVNRFVNVLDKFAYSFDLVKGTQLVDAKSPVGVISMGFAEPVTLRSNCSDEQLQEVAELLTDFIVL